MDQLHSGVVFFLRLLLSNLDSIVATRLHIVNLLKNLTAWVLSVLLIHIALVVLKEVFRVVVCLICSDLSFTVVVENEDLALVKVKFCLLNLPFCLVHRVKGELLGHLLDTHHRLQVVIMKDERARGTCRPHVGIKRHRAVNHTVFSILIAFDGLTPDIFLAIDQVILVTMVEEV